MNFAALEITLVVIELRDWINRRNDYLTNKDGLRAICRKIFEVTGIKFDCRWGERNLFEHIQAFLSKSYPVEINEVIIETEPVEGQPKTEQQESKATVKRVSGRLNASEIVLVHEVELSNISGNTSNIFDPGFYQ